MSDTEAVTRISIDELLNVSDKMIDAGTLAFKVISMIYPAASDSERMVVLWRVMVQAKLGEPR